MNQNLVLEFLEAAESRLDEPFLVPANPPGSHGSQGSQGSQGSPHTYRQVFDRAARYAAALADAGARPGDRVVVQVHKSAEAVALYLGCLWAGTVHVPLNPAFTPDEVAFFVEDAKPAVVVIDPELLSSRGPIQGVDQRPGRLTLDRDGDGTLPEASRAAEPGSPVARSGADLAALLYTSGTTGRPKGAALTHDGLHHNAHALHTTWGFTGDDHLVHALPLFHVHGLFVALHCAMLSAIPVTFLPRFDVDQTLDAIAGPGTVFMAVPTQYGRLLASPRLTRDAVGGMRLFTSGSAPLTPAAFAEFERRTGHRICERYGMSETGITTSNPLHGDRVAGTVGFALPGVELRVLDAEDRPVPSGATGQVAVRGAQLMEGYWQLPEVTAAAHTADGWFRTGDVGSLDPEGRLTLQGRAGDMIITGGENVSPKEIELVLDEVPGVVESAVIGLPHPDLGEQVAVVLVCEGPALDEAALRPTLDAHLARFKHPRRVIPVDALPRNAMGKVQKHLLRSRYGAADDPSGASTSMSS